MLGGVFFFGCAPPAGPWVGGGGGGGAEEALAPLEFGGSVKRTERETDNLLLSISPLEIKILM